MDINFSNANLHPGLPVSVDNSAGSLECWLLVTCSPFPGQIWAAERRQLGQATCIAELLVPLQTVGPRCYLVTWGDS